MTPSEPISVTEALPRDALARDGRPRGDASSLYALTAGLVAASASWFLLKEFGALLRPFVLAVFLAYLVVPIHQWLRRRITSKASAVVILAATLALFWGVAMIAFGGMVELNDDLPRLIERTRGIVAQAREYGRSHAPRWLIDGNRAVEFTDSEAWNAVRGAMRPCSPGAPRCWARRSWSGST